MIENAKAGRIVVRLKGGDPFIFGRGGEEAEVLRDAGIPYEVVPGVTSAVAASAYAELPLTQRVHASAVALITGHENPTKPEISLDWSALAKFPGTLAIYMGMARLDLIVQVLLQHGKPPDTPAAVVQLASTGMQQTRTTTLVSLAEMVRAEGLMPPAIILIGSIVTLRPQRSWFENRPLFGQRVLVTRPRHQAAQMTRQLEELGAIVYSLPAVEIVDPPDWSPVDSAIQQLQQFDWIVFTSSNGVEKFMSRLIHLGLDSRRLSSSKIAAIGPSTADALRRYYLQPDLMPDVFRSEELAAAIRSEAAGKRVLLVRADRGRDVLASELSPVADVRQIAVYSQLDSVDPECKALRALSRGEIRYVTFTSGNIARAVLRKLDETSLMRIRQGTVKIVTISPVTSAAVREFDVDVAAEARTYTVAGIIEAIVELHRHSAEVMSQ
jgi:uroporphyrinogen III methyltransferase/synthase